MTNSHQALILEPSTGIQRTWLHRQALSNHRELVPLVLLLKDRQGQTSPGRAARTYRTYTCIASTGLGKDGNQNIFSSSNLLYVDQIIVLRQLLSEQGVVVNQNAE